MMAKKNDWKKREGVVYSTDGDYSYSYPREHELQAMHPQSQKLIVSLDRKQRAGKQVTLITGFVGTSSDLDSMAKLLKSKCGVGGSVKDGDVLIQGDHRDKIVEILHNAGSKAKRSG
jgi:translation initiation factor 1